MKRVLLTATLLLGIVMAMPSCKKEKEKDVAVDKSQWFELAGKKYELGAANSALGIVTAQSEDKTKSVTIHFEEGLKAGDYKTPNNISFHGQIVGEKEVKSFICDEENVVEITAKEVAGGSFDISFSGKVFFDQKESQSIKGHLYLDASLISKVDIDL